MSEFLAKEGLLLAGMVGGTLWFLLYIFQAHVPTLVRRLFGLPTRQPAGWERLTIGIVLIGSWLIAGMVIVGRT